MLATPVARRRLTSETGLTLNELGRMVGITSPRLGRVAAGEDDFTESEYQRLVYVATIAINNRRRIYSMARVVTRCFPDATA